MIVKLRTERLILTTVKQLGLLIVIQSILFEGAIALGTGIDFRKGLGGSESGGNCHGSGWRKETGSIISQKNRGRDVLYEKPANSDLHKTAWMNMAFHGLNCK